MKKCPICNSCLNKMLIVSKIFYYCDFCRKYYDIGGVEKSEEVVYENLESFEKRQENSETH